MATLITNSDNVSPGTSTVRVLLPQIIAVMVKNVLMFIIGMTVAYPTILIPALANPQGTSNFKLDKEGVSWIGSINLICALVGCSLSGIITQPVGRKRFMQVITIPFMAAWLIFKFANELWQIYFALAMYGLSSGLIEAPVLSYVAEITQPRVRGMLSATGTLSSVLGVLVEFFLGTFLPWRDAAVVSSAVPLIAFFLLCFIPESPHWLVMHKKLQAGQKSLAWLRGWKDVDSVKEEFEEMCQNHNVNYNNCNADANVFSISSDSPNSRTCLDKKFIEPYLKKSFVWPFSLVLFICFLTAFTGFSTLQTYAVGIFTTLHVPINEYYATLGLGIAQFIGSLVSVILVKCFGKRVMAFLSLSCVLVCDMAIGIYGHVTDVQYLNLVKQDILNSSIEINNHQWVPLLILVLLSFFGHCGIRVLPWILIGEIYTHKTRAVGCGLASAFYYVFGFVANKIFLNMINLLTLPGVYGLYGIVCVVGLVVLYFSLPETEGKPLQEIIQHFSGTSKLSNKIYKPTRTTN